MLAKKKTSFTRSTACHDRPFYLPSPISALRFPQLPSVGLLTARAAWLPSCLPCPFPSLSSSFLSLSPSIFLPLLSDSDRASAAAGAVRGKWVCWRSGLRLRLRRLIRMLARPLALPRRPLASCLAPPPLPPPGLALRHSREGKAKGREGKGAAVGWFADWRLD